jgi:hypothetical protein
MLTCSFAALAVFESGRCRVFARVLCVRIQFVGRQPLVSQWEAYHRVEKIGCSRVAFRDSQGHAHS